ncbi:MAG: Mur ligase family protein, partial [Patescibacteria group bacterium]|nr:Mur ligase family protein [Patescibacteria group bacterium]
NHNRIIKYLRMIKQDNLKNYFHQTRRALAKFWLEVNLQIKVVGVTGSYGKTTTVRAIAAVLSGKYSTNQTDLNLDTVYNLPITILKTKLWNEYLVLEYGVDHKEEMDQHLSLVKPKVAVLTGITPVHSDSEHLGSLENIIEEKSKLIKALPEGGLAIFNYDDPEVRKIGQKFAGRKIFYGLDKKTDVWADKIKITLAGTEFFIHDEGDTVEIKTGLLGYPAVYSCLVGYIIGKDQGVKKEKIIEKLAELKPLSGRLSVEPGPRGAVLVNDAKRANPASTIAGLKTLAEFPGRKIAVLGEMGELGDLGEKLHREVGQEAAKLKIDILVGVGPLTKEIINSAKKQGMKPNQLFWVKDVFEAAEILKKILQKDDLLYLKASLLRHLERVILILNGKEVACKEVVCHHYQNCQTCQRLLLSPNLF